MTKHLLLIVLTTTTLLSPGCLFSKKTPRVKENTAISADVEESFRRRWVDKRAAELAAQGTAAETSRVQAEADFRARFGFTRAAAAQK